ncbi:5-(carboxyamino)imidazole ribonucleotide synthase [Salinibacter ruber]|jgi:5-(carboxyamino)imidazole ribonucleotide synthase|uniref:N5-carboxyaminoimidazole ribonucleotide synthase n=1 Tax=Salinibacter ruber TaxID=146919 RepID=A0A9X2UJS2_9BACT|nr:5-(carboxyamino)imidazole ribonucleotide synthase [Salinibacter ruber]MBB4090133.1 5-(carboxyamino)imidazole ribonucleotide synthase [Salinibacter ruber]MCS3611643.1 5-(carboxyamino)imidazole ribonucleotide synthase [Salinibacter ruber]MCS3615134.1 5-(carboxyamino)imidazole ribonucleotide synthase [Salinibacter ruber]MCS3629790.1 5-(carboxyamino)imidazole ribonucleotide synthase [Salinibacter ruber]MCS3636303.1 5-(carboxyamino)imidazole ribonucleotide synthase [Salinibacter ruber]
MSSTFPTIGILGGGQLGKMMAAEAVRMSVDARLLSPKEAGPMQPYTGARVGDWTDPDVLRPFTADCDVVTVESEWAPADAAAEVLPDGAALWPSTQTLSLIKDKGVQKQHLADAGCPVPAFACCETLDEALDAAEEFGYPVVLKQYRGAYDGYGNATAASEDELREAWPDLATEDGAMVETFADFARELAVQVARRPGGNQVVYPVAYTEQRDHRCHAVEVPADIDDAIADKARHIAQKSVDAVEGVGLIAVELFEMPDGRVLVNELAPRPHNTGHYSIEGAATSQFENHVRAVLDWPLGDPSLRTPVAVMVNVLGRREGTPPQTTGLPRALDTEGVTPHIYGKPDVRPGRKMGHVTALGADRADTRKRAEMAASAIEL